jgi:glyoxylase-like metal-dependent hydrolase (beta-lactamase superfamily II)
MRTMPVGQAMISVINVGDFMWNLAEKFNLPESEWRPHHAVFFERSQFFPTQSIHIALPGASVIVDPSDHELAPGFLAAVPEYRQPAPLIAQLAEKGVHPEDITHVAITHAHFDHYASITREQDGQYIPSFPNARCFLSLADWEDPKIQEALQEPGSNESRTLGVLRQRGLLELIEGNCDLIPSVQIIATPGETPGHQIVRVHSHGQTLYCLGDLFHHQVEFEHPGWMVHWKDKDTNLKSRFTLMEAALAEDALLVASHIPVGYLERTASGFRWMPLFP